MSDERPAPTPLFLAPVFTEPVAPDSTSDEPSAPEPRAADSGTDPALGDATVSTRTRTRSRRARSAGEMTADPAASSSAEPKTPPATVEPAVPTTHHDVIADRAGFLAAVEAIAAGHGPIAVDAERASGYRYSQRAYLIQVFRRGAGVFLFDPPPIGDFTPLQDAIGDEEWILHAATQDLTCLREVGLEPRILFDTELGARLAGFERVGLGPVVEQLLGIHLAKEHSAADWSTRPLPQTWLEYAALDVELLVDVRDAMRDQLIADGKLDLAEQEFRDVLQRDLVPVRVEPWRRLTSLHTVRGGRGLAVARELWLARDEYAREIDTAPGRLVPDPSLVAVARILPTDKRAMSAIREFHGRASRSQIDRWWAAVERGMATDDLPSSRGPSDGTALPPPRAWADRNPEADARLKAARTAMAGVAQQLNLPVENLLTPEHLRRVAWNPPEPITTESVTAALAALGARPWQTDATAQILAASFVEPAQFAPEVVEDPSSSAPKDSAAS